MVPYTRKIQNAGFRKKIFRQARNKLKIQVEIFNS